MVAVFLMWIGPSIQRTVKNPEAVKAYYILWIMGIIIITIIALVIDMKSRR